MVMKIAIYSDFQRVEPSFGKKKSEKTSGETLQTRKSYLMMDGV